MSIQHALIPDGQIHEPKGSSTAITGSAYISNGAGSGTWKRPDSLSLSGMTGDGGVPGLIVVTDGNNGFKTSNYSVFGSMAVTGNTNAFSITAAVDSTLNTNSDYRLLTGTGAPWAGATLYGVTFNTDRLTVPINGIYRVDLWSNIIGFPSTSAKVSVKHLINGITYSARHPIVKSNSAGDAGNLDGFGLVQLNANDYMQLVVASTVAGSLTFSDINFTLSIVQPL